ncbi:carnitine/acyl carnitine carrier [Macrolepiota fuliginosa MF-IS2]|uniref:Carnitine/acyl carnitine carrier n=1 Tax=Macrolepiota fuliginosa MF-IS2 TaxID=1400762 RepID=A0A9P6C758_9AGAR|nr:carnitine/acyl carnitine carrier [Macrolepiota fuliginosa MF-IS2]
MSGANSRGEVELDPRLDFFAGTIAGMTSLVVGFPFDTVKVRFQNPEVSGRYSSTFNTITTIIREERFIGLFKGITSPLVSVALMNGLVFASYRFFMKLQLDNPGSIPTLTQITLAGAGSGIVSSIITTPIELIKIRQQSSLTPTTANSVAWEIYRHYGIRGLYRGVTATALRDCGYGAYFFAYEATRRFFTPPASSETPADHSSIFAEVENGINKLSWPALLLAGGVAGIVGWIATFPFDVVKTRIQGSIEPPISRTASTTALLDNLGLPQHEHPNNPFRSTVSTFVYSYKTEGMGVFFRGLAPTLIRAIPVNMVTFATFEAVVHAFS